MARIRTIKPEFWEDEKIGRLPIPCRLFFIGCWNFADDFGCVKGNAALLKSQLFPYDEGLRISEIKKWIDALVDARMLIPIIHNEESYYYIRTFRSHQVLDKRFDKSYIGKGIVNDLISKALRAYDECTPCSRSNHDVITPEEMEMEKERDIPPIIPLEGDGDEFPDEFIALWDNFKGKRKSLADDYKDFCKKTEGLTVDYVKLQYHAQFAKNVYFQTWLNDFFSKKSKREPDLSFVEPSFRPVMTAWLVYKSERGQTYRQQGLQACYSKLRELSNGSPDAAKRIIQQSMANNWAGLFPLKTESNERTPKNQPPGPDELARAVAEGVARAHTRQEWEQ